MNEENNITTQAVELPEEEKISGAEVQKLSEYFSMKSKLNGIVNTKNDISNRMSEVSKAVVKSVGAEDKLDELFKSLNLSMEDVKNATDEQINEWYTVDGEVIILNDKCSDVRELEFKRDLLAYTIETDTIMKKIDDVEKETQMELEKFEKDIAEITNKLEGNYQNKRNMILNSIQDLEGSTSVEGKKRLKDLNLALEAFDDALVCDRIKKTLRSLRVSNIIDDYTKRSLPVYNRFVRNISKINLSHIEIKHFEILEQVCLPKKYQKYPGMFIFLIVRHFSYNKTPSNYEDGTFLVELYSNLRLLVLDKLESSHKEKFINNICEVLDLVYDNIK